MPLEIPDNLDLLPDIFTAHQYSEAYLISYHTSTYHVAHMVDNGLIYYVGKNSNGGRLYSKVDALGRPKVETIRFTYLRPFQDIEIVLKEEFPKQLTSIIRKLKAEIIPSLKYDILHQVTPKASQKMLEELSSQLRAAANSIETILKSQIYVGKNLPSYQQVFVDRPKGFDRPKLLNAAKKEKLKAPNIDLDMPTKKYSLPEGVTPVEFASAALYTEDSPYYNSEYTSFWKQCKSQTDVLLLHNAWMPELKAALAQINPDLEITVDG